MKKFSFSSLLLPAITIIGFSIIYIPVILIIILSFTGTHPLSQIGDSFSLRWYQSLFTSNYDALGIASRFSDNIDPLKQAILNTFAITILSTIISTITGTFIAIGINALDKKKRRFFILMNNMSVVNPDIVTGFLLLLVYVAFETIFGLERGFGTVLISHIFFSIPYVVLNVLPRLKQIDPNTYEAARDLGCTRMQAIFKAIIPSIKTGIIAGALFAFTMSIDDFVITMFASGPEFFNVSTWIDYHMRRGYIPKTVYAYNVIILFIAFIATVLRQTIGGKKIEKAY